MASLKGDAIEKVDDFRTKMFIVLLDFKTELKDNATLDKIEELDKQINKINQFSVENLILDIAFSFAIAGITHIALKGLKRAFISPNQNQSKMLTMISNKTQVLSTVSSSGIILPPSTIKHGFTLGSNITSSIPVNFSLNLGQTYRTELVSSTIFNSTPSSSSWNGTETFVSKLILSIGNQLKGQVKESVGKALSEHKDQSQLRSYFMEIDSFVKFQEEAQDLNYKLFEFIINNINDQFILSLIHDYFGNFFRDFSNMKETVKNNLKELLDSRIAARMPGIQLVEFNITIATEKISRLHKPLFGLINNPLVNKEIKFGHRHWGRLFIKQNQMILLEKWGLVKKGDHIRPFIDHLIWRRASEAKKAFTIVTVKAIVKLVKLKDRNTSEVRYCIALEGNYNALPRIYVWDKDHLFIQELKTAEDIKTAEKAMQKKQLKIEEVKRMFEYLPSQGWRIYK